MKVTLLTGGTGGVKLLLGLVEVLGINNVYIIVNTGDDFEWNGLYISPDLDTVIYALSGMLDLDKMWGIREDTFNFLNQAKILGLEDTWFNIGDRDLAMHILRTYLLKKGYKLSNICDYVCTRLGIPTNISPMTDCRVRTMILTEIGELNIQEFVVKYCKSLKPISIRFEGIENAYACIKAIKFLEKSDIVIIGPSSPPVSILPILYTNPIGDIIRKLNKPKICVLPMIGNRPISGVTDKLMEAIGYEGSSKGILELYSKFNITHIVCDFSDKDVIEYAYERKINVIIDNIVMKDKKDCIRLAEKILNEI